jgi:hypothetical protein
VLNKKLYLFIRSKLCRIQGQRHRRFPTRRNNKMASLYSPINAYDIDSFDFVIKTPFLSQLGPGLSAKLVSWQSDVQPEKYAERLWRTIAEVNGCYVLVPSDVDPVLLLSYLSVTSFQPHIDINSNSRDMGTFVYRTTYVTLQTLEFALNNTEVDVVRINGIGRKHIIGRTATEDGVCELFECSAAFVTNLAEAARLSPINGQVHMTMQVGKEIRTFNDEGEPVALMLEANQVTELGKMETFPLLGAWSGGVQFSPKKGVLEEVDGLLGKTSISKSQMYFPGAHMLKRYFARHLFYVITRMGHLNELVLQGRRFFDSFLTETQFATTMSGIRCETTIEGYCSLKSAIQRLEFCSEHIIANLRSVREVNFTVYQSVGSTFFEHVSAFNFLRKRDACKLGLVENHIQYALLNYLGMYNPRLNRFRVDPTEFDETGNTLLVINIPQNDGNYFVNGVGLPEEPPEAHATRKDIRDHLWTKWMRLGRNSMYGSTRRTGARGPMSKDLNTVYRKVYEESLTKNQHWREMFLCDQDML